MAKVSPTIPLVGSTRWFSVGGVTLCFVLFASLCYVTAGQSWHCGSATETVRTVCDGCYAGGSHLSRNYPKRSHQERIPLFKEPFLEKSYALNFLQAKSHASDDPSPLTVRPRRSGRRGFIDECCRRSCDFFEMIFYCCAAQQKYYAEIFKLVKRSS